MRGLGGGDGAGAGSTRQGSSKGRGPRGAMVLSHVDDVGGEAGRRGAVWSDVGEVGRAGDGRG
jgi:hypothetical protein